MFTRRDGIARYAPECTRSCRSANRPSSPFPYIRHVMPSAPGAASFFNSKYAQRSASTVTWWRSAVRRSRGSRCTNCRIRSAACVTLARPCVRRVLWLPAFPLGSVLRSIDSAGTGVPLFADFTATMTESDFSTPFILGYGFLLSSATPPRQRDGMETSQVPVQCVRTCLGSLTPRDPDPPRQIGESDAAFDTENCLGIPDPIVSMLNGPARTRPCQRLAPALASDGP